MTDEERVSIKSVTKERMPEGKRMEAKGKLMH